MARGRQQRIDFSRAEQLGLLREARLPMQQKAVLRAIDDFGRGGEAWPSQSRLAVAVGCSERHLRRLLSELVDDSLVCITRQCLGDGRRSGNVYVIVWSELALLSQASGVRQQESAISLQESAPGPPEVPDIGADQPDICAYQSDICADQPDICAYQPDNGVRFREAPKETLKEPPPPSAHQAAAEDVGHSEAGDGEPSRLADALKAAGIERIEPVIREATERGLSAEALRTIVRDYTANRPKFIGPGAIVDRIRSGAWPAAGVVPAATLARRQAESQQQRQAAEASRRQADRRAELRRQVLEARHGPALAALDSAARYDLLAALNPFAARLYRANPAGDFDLQLLEALEQQAMTRAEVQS